MDIGDFRRGAREAETALIEAALVSEFDFWRRVMLFEMLLFLRARGNRGLLLIL